MDELVRAGASTLTLLGSRGIFPILCSLSEGMRGQFELRREAGSLAQSTLRGHLKALEDAKAVTKHRREEFPGTVEYRLTEAGHELLAVGERLATWLDENPEESLELGSAPAKTAIKGLVDGWLARMLDPLADGPLSLTELDKRLSTISYPTVERRLETMRLAGQVDARRRAGVGTPYVLTEWLRKGTAPLVVAARWEHLYAPANACPIARPEIETALKIAAPLLKMETGASGCLQWAVRAPTRKNRRRRFLGLIELQNGELTDFSKTFSGRKPDAWASGTPEVWFSTIVDGNTTGLRLSGDRTLAEALLAQIHNTLFVEGNGFIPLEAR